MSIFVLMAGGTGGHLFPAMALAQELRRRGHITHLMTDHRATSYGDQFPARDVHVVPSATPSVRNPLKFVGAIAAPVVQAPSTTNPSRPKVISFFIRLHPCVRPIAATALDLGDHTP